MSDSHEELRLATKRLMKHYQEVIDNLNLLSENMAKVSKILKTIKTPRRES